MEIESNKNKLIEYLMWSIFSNHWKEGEKIFSLQQLANKFEVSKSTVSKVVSNFIAKGWFEAREKKGVYLARSFDALFPLSFRKIMNIENENINTKISNLVKDVLILEKEYMRNDKKIATNITIINDANFELQKFNNTKPLWYNLSIMNIIPFEIEEYTTFENVDSEMKLHVTRRYLNKEKIMFLVEEYFINPKYYSRAIVTKIL